jgi:hypothetical protein
MDDEPHSAPPSCEMFVDAYDALELLHGGDSRKALRLACLHYGISIEDGERLLIEFDEAQTGNF